MGLRISDGLLLSGLASIVLAWRVARPGSKVPRCTLLICPDVIFLADFFVIS